MRTIATMLAGGALALAAGAAPASADTGPFGHACQAQNGVRFCPTTSLEERVPSWDGTPLDVDVTLPATGAGRYPTIVILHGLGGDKAMFEDTSAEGSNALSYHYNNVYYAQKGYAVVNATARGFGNSCGSASKDSAGCARGWARLDDTRYEARDVQHLLGRLVDEGVADPDALGVTGVSYGGGTSAQLAFLKDRVQREDGSFAPWRSPAGTPLAFDAAYPRWGWQNLATALVPNGRAGDDTAPDYARETTPAGVAKLSYTTFLYLISSLVGNLAPEGAEPSADLTGWYKRIVQGEPYAGSTVDSMIAALRFKGTGGVPGAPASMLIENGWTDQLFPAQQGLALYDQARAASPGADVTLQLADTGHMPASNRTDLVRRLVDQGAAFFDAKLRGAGGAPAPSSVRLYPMTCPAGAQTPDPIVAASWQATRPGTLSYSSTRPQSTTSSGLNLFGQIDDDPVLPALGGTIGDLLTGVISGDLDIGGITGGAAFGSLFTQALQNSDPCRTVRAGSTPNSIEATGPVRPRAATLVGMPRVTVDLAHTGGDGQLAARLWDVAPDGRKTLVTRGVYRVARDQRGRASFQLDGNAYTFAAGHRPRLELLSTDAPYLRPSNGIGSTLTTRVAVDLPTAEARP
jgi:hypothetical protein